MPSTTSHDGGPGPDGWPLHPGDPGRVGLYELTGRLGEGGMGTVFAGTLERDGRRRRVAVKMIRSEFGRQPDFRARFRREATNARRVARFCTAEVLDADPDADPPYLVTEYVDGPTLSDVVRELGPLSHADLERVAVSVAAALTAIHGAGVVHRDLKPSNVLLSRFGPRVIDFGIARALDATTGLSQDVGRIGTPAFMAPEQVRGEEITPAADIFAWGGVVLYAATGRFPFGEGATPVLLYRAVYEEPDLSGLDPGLRSIVGQAMAKDPAERPSAQALLMRLLGDPTGGTNAAERAVTAVLAGWEVPASARPADVAAAPTTRAGTLGATTPADAGAAPTVPAGRAGPTTPAGAPTTPADTVGPTTPDRTVGGGVGVTAPRPRVPGSATTERTGAAATRTRFALPVFLGGADETTGAPRRRGPLVACVAIVTAAVIAGIAVLLTSGGGGGATPTPLPPGAARLTEDGPPVMVALASNTATRLFAFDGEAGTKVFVAGTDCDDYDTGILQTWQYTLTSPTGDPVAKDGAGCGNDAAAVTLPDRGQYRLTVATDGSAEHGGRFAFRLRSVPPTQNFTVAMGRSVGLNAPATGAGQIESPGATDRYTIQGRAAEQVVLTVTCQQEHSFTFSLTSPSDRDLFDSPATCGSGTNPVTLPDTGGYVVTVTGQGAGTGTYGFALRDVARTQTFPIGLGSQVSPGSPGSGAGSIDTAGAQDAYTFDVTGNQRILLDAPACSNGTGLQWTLTGSSGTAVFSDEALCDSTEGPYLLPAAGRYTLSVSGQSGATADYSFRLLSVPAPQQAALPVGTTVAGRVTVPGAATAYTFAGRNGAKLSVDLLGCQPDDGFDWVLDGPDGSQVASSTASCGVDDSPTELSASGRYMLTVRGDGITTGAYEVRVRGS